MQEVKLRELVAQYSEFINFPIYLWSTKEVQQDVPLTAVRAIAFFSSSYPPPGCAAIFWPRPGAICTSPPTLHPTFECLDAITASCAHLGQGAHTSAVRRLVAIAPGKWEKETAETRRFAPGRRSWRSRRPRQRRSGRRSRKRRKPRVTMRMSLTRVGPIMPK